MDAGWREEPPVLGSIQRSIEALCIACGIHLSSNFYPPDAVGGAALYTDMAIHR
jgi:hypothetical protein